MVPPYEPSPPVAGRQLVCGQEERELPGPLAGVPDSVMNEHRFRVDERRVLIVVGFKVVDV